VSKENGDLAERVYLTIARRAPKRARQLPGDVLRSAGLTMW
jgi:hypothetical protein